MKKQRRSITQIAMDNLIFIPTKRSRNRKKPTPTESDIVTFNYTAHLWDMRWLRTRARRKGA